MTVLRIPGNVPHLKSSTELSFQIVPCLLTASIDQFTGFTETGV
jgi:hypothetical protein